ncbi:MAG: anthranilate phosphoribosyltransferase [Clostridia bacterium]|nr:anthranilate phosphoribosyltransferase [Lachnospiraceae bacterium]NCB99755.1 anthranilate phosphoribosyltransferase [Clostridia bacterium]NCD03882.1 anthranilate phosphoribosyltransferase [Clostridia bacterium]
MIQEAIKKVVEGQNLDFNTAKTVMDEVMSGRATNAQMGAFLTALRMKGETVDEITACASSMREKCEALHTETEVMDIVGTGGDEVGTFNISTTTAFVVAAGGVPVAKHGNRSVSSKSGAADVLESLGTKLTLTAKQCEKVLKDTGICFMFAQMHHSSMKYAAPVRKELGTRTVFNILGPLTNPAAASMQLMGVYNPDMVESLAQVLSNLGVNKGFVVCGNDGLDEVSLTGPTHVCHIDGDKLDAFDIVPEEFGLKTCELSELIGGNPAENAEITKNILSGKERGAKRDVVVLNASLALAAALDKEIGECVTMAENLIDSGKAMQKMQAFIKATNEVE